MLNHAASKTLLLTCLSLAISERAVAEPTTRLPVHPNIVMVFIDDMGWADLSCFGNREVETENIDRLCAEGIRFTNFYVNSPICSPSRTALTTGQYPQRWKITSYLAHRQINDERGMAQWLDPTAPTLARQLRQAGYATGHFGKWHMGGQRDVGEAPLIQEYGFDASLTNFEGLGPRVLPLCDAYDGTPPRKHALGSDTLGRGPITWENRTDITTAFVRRTLEFVKEAQAAGRPFYVNVWPDDVHSPFFPPQARRGDSAKRTLYLGVLDTMDEQLGELFDYIRGSETLRDTTLILIASDNGPEAGAGTAGRLRGSKGMLYEGGIRSPLIVWGPGFLAARSRGWTNETAILSSLDLVPSILSLARATIPPQTRLDGEDLSQTLLGHVADGRRQPIFWRRPPDRPGASGVVWPDLAVRDGPWKLLIQYDGLRDQLYNVIDDPGETSNVSESHADVVERLKASLLAWHAELPPDAGPSFTLPKQKSPAKATGLR